MKYRICINPDCGIVVREDDCMDYKHPVGERLCPECYEVTEAMREREVFEWTCPHCGARLPSTIEHCSCAWYGGAE